MLDLDYIAPSNACIKPTLLSQTNSSGAVHRYEPGRPVPAEEIIKISLQDCLACSGCITTAETMLITSQSRDEVLREAASPSRRRMAVSVSDQSASSIAVQLGCSTLDAMQAICGFCRDVIGAELVVDLRWAQRLTLEHTAAEFIRRVRLQPDALPLIVSACPGIVCYFEKTHPQLLPFLCPVMSSQGIAGAYMKQHVDPSLYHISVQPCFDKKLEAVRDRNPHVAGDSAPSTLGVDGSGLEGAYTDCVLSTQELLEWMREVCPEPLAKWSAPLDSAIAGESLRYDRGDSAPCEATGLEGSGGFHQFTMQAAAVALSGSSLPLSSIVYQTKRNSNHRIATAEPQLPGMAFGVGYGFQHVQNIVRGLNRPTSTTPRYVFIELMACPDGCLNGGGQVRTQRPADTLHNVKGAFVAHTDHVMGSPTGSDDECSSRKKAPRTEADGAKQRSASFSSESLRRDWLGQSGRDGDDGGVVAADARVRTTFTDRKQDMLALEGQLNVHSLKW